MTVWRAVMMLLGFVCAVLGWYAYIEGDMVSAGVMTVCVALCCAGSWRG